MCIIMRMVVSAFLFKKIYIIEARTFVGLGLLLLRLVLGIRVFSNVVFGTGAELAFQIIGHIDDSLGLG